jgi:hypothetical protein
MIDQRLTHFISCDPPLTEPPMTLYDTKEMENATISIRRSVISAKHVRSRILFSTNQAEGTH